MKNNIDLTEAVANAHLMMSVMGCRVGDISEKRWEQMRYRAYKSNGCMR